MLETEKGQMTISLQSGWQFSFLERDAASMTIITPHGYHIDMIETEDGRLIVTAQSGWQVTFYENDDQRLTVVSPHGYQVDFIENDQGFAVIVTMGGVQIDFIELEGHFFIIVHMGFVEVTFIEEDIGGGALPPIAGFSATPLRGPIPLTVQFTDESTGGITDWLWDFGDGQLSTDSDPLHTYNSVGAYTVMVRVTGAGGVSENIKSSYIQADPGGQVLPRPNIISQRGAITIAPRTIDTERGKVTIGGRQVSAGRGKIKAGQ